MLPLKKNNIDKKYIALEKILHGEYGSVLGSTIKQIKTYFLNSRYSSREPRVYVHISVKNELINLLPENFNDGPPKKISDFSIFKHVLDSGTPYLDNNIINTALTKEDYKHSGLDLTKIAHKYKNYGWKIWKKRIPQRIKRLFTGRPDLDQGWKSCFKDSNQTVDKSYKSHLAIPITFKAHIEDGNLNKDLIKLLKLDQNGRMILGILVVDHVDTHYFDHHDPLEFENVDANIMYQFADLISLVILLHYNFSDGSETYSKYKNSQAEEV